MRSDFKNLPVTQNNLRSHAWGRPSSMYRQKLKKKDKWDIMCSSPVVGCQMPEVLKRSFIAACDGIDFTSEGGIEYIVCPAPQDCLAKAIPARPTLTISEAKAFAASGNRPVSTANVGGNTNKIAHDSFVQSTSNPVR